MNRVIKYQAWDKVNKVMRDVWSITWDFKPETPTAIIACNPVINSEYILHEGQFELRQYAGLIDKNSKEIYEGDICNAFAKLYEQPRALLIKVIYNEALAAFQPVQWWNGDKEWKPFYNNFQDYNFEIIGNIYEHPHLLSNK